ncbi:MAG: hypothetical protein U9R42_07175, partial [Bacteroidota bacterium]|nr:hypothetical protein [Bacteroidota bacterium]
FSYSCNKEEGNIIIPDPNNQQPTIPECQEKNFGYIRFDNRTDKELCLFETINLIDPFIELPANCITYTKADSGKIIYKLDFLNCQIGDKYGQFKINKCDTTNFFIYGNAVIEITY